MLMASLLLWYKKFRRDLEAPRIEFKFNPYDPCVANRIVVSQKKQQKVPEAAASSAKQGLPVLLPGWY
jgi:hypothetical protein